MVCRTKRRHYQKVLDDIKQFERMSTSKTGRGTAALRAIESSKSDRLINDPFAHLLGLTEGNSWVNSLPDDVRNLMIDLLAVRTRIFDDICLGAVAKRKGCLYQYDQISISNEENSITKLFSDNDAMIKQVVILGAGFDTRSYRISEFSETDVYEIDFKEVLESKHDILVSEGVVPICRNHHLIQVDLATDNFTSPLVKKGFRAALPTLWLLEGLTGYVNEAENKLIIKEITQLSYNGSIVVSTFLGNSKEAYGTGSTERKRHQFYTDESVLFYQNAGWYSAQKRIAEFSALFNRSTYLNNYDYWITFSKMIKPSVQKY